MLSIKEVRCITAEMAGYVIRRIRESGTVFVARSQFDEHIRWHPDEDDPQAAMVRRAHFNKDGLWEMGTHLDPDTGNGHYWARAWFWKGAVCYSKVDAKKEALASSTAIAEAWKAKEQYDAGPAS